MLPHGMSANVGFFALVTAENENNYMIDRFGSVSLQLL